MDEGRLRAEMRAAADALAESHSLDFSVESLDRLERLLATDDPGVPDRAAAYLGEVLVRQQPLIAWCWPPRRLGPRGDEPALRVPGGEYAQPIDRIRRTLAPHDPRDTLQQYAADLLTWAASPTEATAAALGWSTQSHHPTRGDHTRLEVQRLRAWWRERRTR